MFNAIWIELNVCPLFCSDDSDDNDPESTETLSEQTIESSDHSNLSSNTIMVGNNFSTAKKTTEIYIDLWVIYLFP